MVTTSLNSFRKRGVVWVDRATDAAFRKALMDGVPPQLRGKMHEALSATPGADAMAHSVRYFGPELADIKNRIAPLIMWLDRFLRESYGLPSIFEWMDATNFGSDYRMIKVFAAWADMVHPKATGLPDVPHG